MTPTPTQPEHGPGDPDRLNVLIAGSGVAGLEAAFGLRTLAGDRVTLRILSPADEFVYRPMAIGEPFVAGRARRYALASLAREAGAELIHEGVKSVDPARREVLTGSEARLGYDALVLCPGARMHHPYAHTTPFDDSHLDELLHGLVQDVEQGYVRRLAVLVPAPMPWPLPAYELALQTSTRAWEMGADTDVTVFTPETAPLAVFGAQASHELSRLLAERRIDVVTCAHCEVPKPQTIVVHPGGREVRADRIVSLPTLLGPSIDGLPQDGNGFIPVDEYGRVHGTERVWAAGDATDYPLRHGGIAAQLADTIAYGIAALAGADVQAEPFEPVLQGVLLTGSRPRYVHGRPPAGEADTSGLTPLPANRQPPKITARFLIPHLSDTGSGVNVG